MDADMTEDLLQETNFTLDRAITKCQAQEAAKKQQACFMTTALNQ